MATNVFPVARYERASDAIKWLNRAFGFEEQVVYPGPNDTIAHAELRFGTGTIGLSSAGPVDPDNVWTTVREGVYASVDDADAVHAQAVKAGAAIARPLQDTDYGSREFSARDLEGHLWSFGTYTMADLPSSPVFYPDLRYSNGRAAVDFLTRAFGFHAGLRVPDDNGEVRHAELWLGHGVLMVDADPDPDGRWGGRRQCTCVHTEDPDAHFARASSAGARIVQPVTDTSYGARGYLAQDPEGFLWCFSTYRPALVNA